MLLFPLSFLSIVIYDLLLKLFFFLNSVMLNVNSLFVAHLDLGHEHRSLAKFFFLLASFFRFQILNLLENQLFFPLLNFSVCDALHFPFFDLVDDDESTLALGVLALGLPLFLVLQAFQPLNFHHQVQALLLSPVLVFQTFLFFQLSVSDCDTLRIDHHLIHVFHIILLFVQLCFCLLQN